MKGKKKQSPWTDFGFGALGGAVGNLINLPFQELARSQNFFYGEKAADNADARWRNQYLDFFSPAAQIQQYREAGLSPSLLYGGPQGSGGATAPQGGGAGGLQSGFAPLDPTQLAMIDNIKADTKLKESQATNTGADTQKKLAEIAGLNEDKLTKIAQRRLITAQAEYQEGMNFIQGSTFNITLEQAQVSLRIAYEDLNKVAAEARTAGVQADIDEATFQTKVAQVWADYENTLADTDNLKSLTGLNKQQIGLIVQQISNVQWQTWAIEKEQNRKDASFYLDQERLKADIEKWCMDNNTKLAIAQIEAVTDMVGYVCNTITLGMSGFAKPTTSSTTSTTTKNKGAITTNTTTTQK